MPEVCTRIAEGQYALVVIDPIYKLLGGRDENAAGDIADLCNELERLAVNTGAAVAFAAHYSKGNQAGKQAMDRIGGSGVFAQDADSIITLTQHQMPDCLTVDLILRNSPEQKPFVVRWNHPLMIEAHDLNPDDLKAANKKNEIRVPTLEEFVAVFCRDSTNPRQCLLSAGQLKGEFRKRKWEAGIAPELRDEAEGQGLLAVYHGPHNQKLAGLTDMVAAHKRNEEERRFLLERDSLKVPTKPKRGKKCTTL